MKFLDIPIAAGEADSAEPRAAPEDVPDKLLIDVPKTLESSDTPPTRMVVALEGTAAQTIGVTPWVMAEAPQGVPLGDVPDPATRRFYAVGTTETVTAGGVQELACFPGKMYIQVSDAPADASTLRIGFAP